MLVQLLLRDRGAALDEGGDDAAPSLVGQADAKVVVAAVSLVADHNLLVGRRFEERGH